MAIAIQKWGFTFSDLRGHVGKCGGYVSVDGSVANSLDAAQTLVVAIRTATIALTNGVIVGEVGPNAQVYNRQQYGATGAYANAETKLRMIFRAADQTLHRYEIPAPLQADFLADRETASGTAVAALVAAMVASSGGAVICARSGSPLTASVGGLLIRRKYQRKANIWEKSANLDEPEE